MKQPQSACDNIPTPIETSVLKFFLELYKFQLGFSHAVRTGVSCLDRSAQNTESTYELYIIDDQVRKTRRMALAPLGENSGSKSKCYKVIYDDLLVVKIPPKPIVNFDEYIETINAEQRIADQLMPDIECIAPSVSALLHKLPKFSKESKLTPDQIESCLIKKLRQNPELQHHLKISKSFAFFMSLAQYSFLGHIIEKMHNIEKNFHEEIFSQFDILWNLTAFEGLYGIRNAQIFFNISEIYKVYEERLNTLLNKNKLNISVFMYKRKEWFLLYLADKKVENRERKKTPDLFKELDLFFQEISTAKKAEIQAYRQMMREHVRQKIFGQNKAQFKGIITNILGLLYRLKKKGVAIRDLKPDNMFVVGGDFLQTASDFSLGLIDFETAVNFRPEQGPIAQPLLAGTPSYATPSHLVKNEVIRESLVHLPRVLHFQDWQAGLGMIFYVTTGNRLFEKSRKWINETWRLMQLANINGVPAVEAFKKSSHFFWDSALSEFKEKMNAHAHVLKATEIILPPNVKFMLKQEATQNRNHILRMIQRHVRLQKIFRSEKSHSDLMLATHQIIKKSRQNWETGVNVPQAPPGIRTSIIKLLNHIEYLKFRNEMRLQLIRNLDRADYALSVYDLQELMFYCIFGIMYKNEWGELDKPSAESLSSNNEKDSEEESTIPYEDTITPDETISYEKTVSYDDTVPYNEATIQYGQKTKKD